MPQDITAQILSQTAESIQKLYDLSTRIDERVKAIQEDQKGLEQSLSVVQHAHTEIMKKVAVLEAKDTLTASDINSALESKFHVVQNELKKELTELEKRVIAVEAASGQNKDRWNRIFTFIIQIIWVLLAAWLLMKLGLQAPAVP